ncbi:hypothetical protein T12_3687 [Trichinella patagoniensis]|uniref:Uncharacterized protein n=1 Tax=Trichinella patagoniensis TaxID=990121 RepID=A0A0V1AFS8_9BILA|nr:hypothetical protein T12_3687 [Trichinella patagoniensis]
MNKPKCVKMEPCNDSVFQKPNVKINAQKWVPLTVLRLLIVGQVYTKDACERRKSNNLARCQLLTDHHERSNFYPMMSPFVYISYCRSYLMHLRRKIIQIFLTIVLLRSQVFT